MKKDEGYWRSLVLLFFFGWVLCYTNRTILSPLLPVIEAEWSLSPVMLGLTHSIFFLIYTLMQIPTGVWADRWGRKLFLVSGFLIQGIGSLFSGLSGGINTFLAARFFTGLGQGSYYANQYALALNEIPPQHRATGTAIINSGMSLGIALGMCLSSWLVYLSNFSWRIPFILLGLCTLVFTMILAKKVRENSAAANRATVQTGSKPTTSVLFTRNNIFIFAISFSTMYAFYLILTWLPYYLQTAWHVSGNAAGLLTAIVPFVAIFSGILAGRAADLLYNRFLFLVVLYPIAAVSTLIIMKAASLGWLITGLVLYGAAGHLTTDPLCVSLLADASPPGNLATLFGIKNFITCIPTIVAPTLTGLLVELTGTFSAAFGIAAALQILSVICLLGLNISPKLPAPKL